MARNIWMGNWNPAKDREPDKKQEMAFKQFLMSKYERKQWYKSPAEVKAATAATVQTKVEQKLKPPPSTAKVCYACGYIAPLHMWPHQHEHRGTYEVWPFSRILVSYSIIIRRERSE